jgi:hypothetical protein
MDTSSLTVASLLNPPPVDEREFANSSSYQFPATPLYSRKSNHRTVQTITNNRQWPHSNRMADRNWDQKEAFMKHTVRVMSLLMALSGVVPAAPAQTPPAQTPPAQTPPAQPPPAATQPHHPKANGAAKGAAIGAMGGNAAKGAVIGAGHSRREERRTERHK